MNEDMISRHLADTADAISLPPADLAGVARRGRNRRTRRRLGLVGAVAVVATVAGSVAFREATETPVESALAAAVVPSNLDWTVLSPESGLGYGRSSAVVDGALYSLSTAPGPYREDNEPTHLYRSTDGADWVEVALPDGVATSSLAAGDGALYAIGTAPASGGGRDLVVATSRDGAGTWSQVKLPDDVAALERAHPDRVVISQPSIASTDGTELVATVVVTATPDWSVIDNWGGDITWRQTEDGIDVYASTGPGGPDSGVTTTVVPSADPTQRDEVDEDGRRQAEADDGDRQLGELISTFTWAELGITPELQPFVDGRTYVYASSDGETFEPVEIPTQGGGAQVVAVDGSYRLFVSSYTSNDGAGSTSVLRSDDGRSWSVSDVLPGSAVSAGSLGDRAAFAAYTEEGQEVYVEVGGVWTSLDVARAVPEGYWVGDVAFGPMGMAATSVSDDGKRVYVVHSADGSAISAVDLADLVNLSDKAVTGVSVSADAVTARLSVIDDDKSTPPEQVVIVGTPR